MTDARIVRTRAALHDAILELCSQKAVTEVTVSELAEAAAINRVTFYKHYASPSEALRAALTLELDPTRALLVTRLSSDQVDPRQDFIDGVNLVLDHIERFRCLYEISFSTPDDGAVPNVLTVHFVETLRIYLDHRRAVNDCLPEFDPEVVASFFGSGLLGTLYYWVRKGTQNREELVQSMMTLTPDWWFPEAKA